MAFFDSGNASNTLVTPCYHHQSLVAVGLETYVVIIVTISSSFLFIGAFSLFLEVGNKALPVLLLLLNPSQTLAAVGLEAGNIQILNVTNPLVWLGGDL